MTPPEHSPQDGSRRAFLVERYLSPTVAAGLAASTARLARLCAGLDHIGPRVQYLYSAYLPAEDTCFCLFRAPSSLAVRELNHRAGFALDRIIEAVLLPTDEIAAQPDGAGTEATGTRP
jgi:hypothetical protein